VDNSVRKRWCAGAKRRGHWVSPDRLKKRQTGTRGEALLVAGKAVVERGKLPGVDLKELGRQARSDVQRLLASVG
jgi:hypothetical protein